MNCNSSSLHNLTSLEISSWLWDQSKQISWYLFIAQTRDLILTLPPLCLINHIFLQTLGTSTFTRKKPQICSYMNILFSFASFARIRFQRFFILSSFRTWQPESLSPNHFHYGFEGWWFKVKTYPQMYMLKTYWTMFDVVFCIYGKRNHWSVHSIWSACSSVFMCKDESSWSWRSTTTNNSLVSSYYNNNFLCYCYVISNKSLHQVSLFRNALKHSKRGFFVNSERELGFVICNLQNNL